MTDFAMQIQGVVPRTTGGSFAVPVSGTVNGKTFNGIVTVNTVSNSATMTGTCNGSTINSTSSGSGSSDGSFSGSFSISGNF